MMEDVWMRYSGQWVVRLLAAASMFCGLLVVAWLASVGFFGDGACEFTPGSSNYGEATLSWLPPGRTCTYRNVVAGEVHTDSPEWSRLLILAIALVGPLVTISIRRALTSVAEPAETR